MKGKNLANGRGVVGLLEIVWDCSFVLWSRLRPFQKGPPLALRIKALSIVGEEVQGLASMWLSPEVPPQIGCNHCLSVLGQSAKHLGPGQH